MRTPRHLAWWTGGLFVAAVIAVGAYRTLAPQPAPDVGFTRLDGSASRIGELQGRVVLVNFWATTCAVCVKEMPQLVATHEKYKTQGFETLAVSMKYDPPASVVNFSTSRRLPFTVVIDLSGEIAQRFGDVRATPTSVLIDRRGRIVQRIEGQPDFAALHRRIDGLLAEAAL
jgi:peroxiredoxin